MPKYRDVYLENRKTLADSGTETIDIAVVDPISELYIEVRANNHTTAPNANNPIARNITKIEVVDGSDKIVSLDGELVQALYYYLTGAVPHRAVQEWASTRSVDTFPLRFGRWLWDPNFALIPQRFRNLQLKVSWDMANINSVGANGYATNTAQLTVVARVMEEVGVDPTGFLMSKDHFSFTTAASGDERIALPTDWPYVLFMLRAAEYAAVGTQPAMTASVTNLKLSIDQDKDIPWDLDSGDVERLMEEMYGRIDLWAKVLLASGDDRQLWLGLENRCQINGTDGNNHIWGVDPDSGITNVVVENNAGAAQTAAHGYMHANGQGFWNTWGIPFGNIDDPATWLDAPTFGDIKAILTQGNAGANANVVLAQARSY